MARSSTAKLLEAVGRAAAPATPAPAQAEPGSGSTRATTREGKVQIGAWLSPDYRSGLRAIQVQHPEKNTQSLISEALNDLFEKYRVPTVRDS